MKRIYNPTERTAELLRNVSQKDLLPSTHYQYLLHMRDLYGFTPTTVYDIGACVLHWTNKAKTVWPEAEFVLFEALRAAVSLYDGYQHHIGVLSDEEKVIPFYENNHQIGGNSYYRESTEFSPDADTLYGEEVRFPRLATTLDDVVARRGFPPPQLIKIDVQGCELDILRGAPKTLATVEHLIVELQHVQYNTGAPLADQTIDALATMGFTLARPRFSSCGQADADYHFVRS